MLPKAFVDFFMSHQPFTTSTRSASSGNMMMYRTDRGKEGRQVKRITHPSKIIWTICLFGLISFNAYAATTVAPAAPTWGLDPVTGTLLTPGITVNTMGTLQVPRPGDGDHTLKLFDVRSATLSPARPVQAPDTHLHHNWDVGSIGNVFGLAIDNSRNIYTTASTHFGSYYGFEIGNEARILFGSIGAGVTPDTAAADTNPGTLNDLSAAGATYKIDAVTGNVTLFATLPQTATVFNHQACEGGPAIPRNTGPALGNVAYDKVRNNLYISNFEDGKIYMFDAGATVPAGGFDETDALDVFDPVGFDGLTSTDQASPYGLAVSPDGTKLYYGTHEINKNPQLFAVNLAANGSFVGSEIDQQAQLVTDLQYTQDLGGVFSSDSSNSHAWVAYSDLNFSPAGELIIGLRTGCLNNFATSHNHGGAFYLLKQDAGGLYNTPADKVPGTGTTYTGNPDTTTAFTNASPAEAATRAGGGRYDAGAISIYTDKVGVGAIDSGPDDGYGGIAIYDKGDGTYDYLATSSDMTVEQGPHGFMLFPHNFTLNTSSTPGTNVINPLASFPSLPSSTTSPGVDYKGVGGDIEVLSVLVDWGDAPDTYSTDLITGNATGGADVRGPTHILTADGIILGTTVDFEFNGVPSVDADGDDNASTPDDEDGISAFPILVSGATSYTIPIANISAANSSAGAVTIHAWIDFDGNGVFDPDEYTTTTVASGATSPATALTWSGAGVSGLSKGTTYARFRITNDSSINATTPGGTASNGEVEDYALEISAFVSLGSTIWEDTDADGTQDAAEPAIVGATVTLLNANGSVFDSDPLTAGVQALTDVTDADGQYNFDGIPENDYRVQVDLSTVTGGDNYIPTPTQVADPDAAGPGQDNNTDSNVDTAFDPNVNDLIHTSGVFTLSVGGEPTGETDPIGAGGVDQPNQGLTVLDDPDNSGNMTVDMGFIKPVSLGSTAWLDSDEDGLQDAAEPGIVGATVTLLNANGTVFDNDPNTVGVQALTDTTDADGQYNFNDIPAGDYRVQIDLATATNTNANAFVPTPSQVADPDAPGPGQDNNTDSNIDLAFDPNTADQIHTSGVVTLSLGGEPTGEIDPIGAGGPDQPNQGLTAANQPDSDGNMTVDFGFFAPVSLGSSVWFDSDNDGIQDAAEPAIVGVTVTLLNANGTVYDSDPVAAGVQALTDVTDADGQYNFNGLSAGDYRVQVDLNTATSHTGGALRPSPIQVADPDAAGPGQDNNTDSNVDSSAPGHNPAGNIYQSGVVSLSVGGEPTGEFDPIGAGGADQPNQAAAQPDANGNMTVDFAFFAPVSLGSSIWDDSDADGTQDASEPAIVGATVTLLNANGTVYDSDPIAAGIQALTDITDGDGQYNFDGLPPGDYRVQVDLSTVTGGQDFIPSPVQVADPDAAGPGQDNNTDSNVDIAFDPNTSDQIHTSGVVTLTVGGEPTGETDPIGAGGADQPNQGLTATDDPDNAGNMTVDMGFIKPVSLGSSVWFDSDSDGVQDSGEPAIVGVTVTLLNANGTVYDSDPVAAGVQALTDVTDAEGQYNFNGLPAGDYRVQVDLNTATSHTGGSLNPSPIQVADPDAAGPGQDNNTDSNVDSSAPGHNPAGNIYQSGVVSLSVGGEPTGEADPVGTGGADQPNQTAAQPDANGNMTVDFAFFAPVSLGSSIWDDSDADGAQDALEPAIVGATVNLLNADGTVYDSDPIAAGIQALTDITDADGQYNFDGLPPGDYRIQVDLSTVTGGESFVPSPVQVADPDAAGPGQDNNTDSNVDVAFDPNTADQIHTSGVVTLTAGGEPTGETDPIGAGGADQPNQGLTATDDPDNAGNMTVDMGFIKPVSLGSSVWFDSDSDGTQDNGEPAIVGATVTLLNADGTVYDSDSVAGGVQALTDTTDGDGQYNFNGLSAGDYRVQVDLTTATSHTGSALSPSPTQVADPDAAGPGQDNNTDSNIDSSAPGHNPAGSIYQSGVVSLSVGGEPTGETDPIGAGGSDQPNQGLTAANEPDNSGNMTVDFGFFSSLSIGSVVWDDSNSDGIQDALEPTLENAVVSLLVDDGTSTGTFIQAIDIHGVNVDPQVTLADGLYDFNELPEGLYKVVVTPPPGYVPSPVQEANADGNALNDSNIAAETSTPGTYESGVVELLTGDEPTETGNLKGDDVDNAAESNGNMTVDFGFVQTASVNGRVWIDTNTNNNVDDGLVAEQGVVGVMITLIDVGPDGQPDTLDDFVVDTTTTGANGLFSFTDVTPSEYFIEFEEPTGMTFVVANQPGDDTIDSDADEITGLTDTFVLNPGQVVSDIDAGVNPGAVGDRVWLDVNQNGVQDAGEPGVPGITVDLLDSTGTTILDTTVTGVDGIYAFNNLAPGDYIIEFDIPAQMSVVPQNTGLDDSIDSDVDPNATDKQIPVTVISGPGNQTYDAGIEPAFLGNFVWLDSDNNGEQDAGEPGIEGVTVELLASDGTTVVQTTTTDSNGEYGFAVIPDDYIIHVVAPAGVSFTTADDAADDKDSDVAIADGKTAQISLASGDDDQTWDAGVVPANLSGTVFLDLDADGVEDAGEPGIDAVTITLTGTDLYGNPVSDTTTTDGNGDYSFTVVPGTYTLVETDPTDFSSTGSEPGTVGSTVDSNNQLTVTIVSGDDSQNNDFLDTNVAFISGQVRLDTDVDGDTNDADSGIAGVTIELLDDQNNVVDTAVTDGNGDYSFTNVQPGDYTIRETDSAGHISTADVDGANDNIIAITLPPGGTSTGNDYLDTIDTGVISGQVRLDSDNDGDVNDADSGISGVTIELLDDQSNVIDTTVTDSSGNYSFTNVAPGDYTIRETDPANHISTADVDGANDNTIAVTLPPGGSSTGNDYLDAVDTGVISGQVRLDSDSDGDVNDADSGIAGVTIELLNDQGNVVDTTVTDGNGHYSFSNVAPGDYTIRETDPAGHTSTADIDGGNDNQIAVTLSAGGSSTGNDYLDSNPGNNAGVTGVVWFDDDKDGVKDPDESGLPGWQIQIVDNGGSVVDTLTTQADGTFSNLNLVPGDYNVQFISPGGIIIQEQPITLNPGDVAFVPEPIDPSGIVYDETTGDAVPGTQVFLLTNGIPLPPACLGPGEQGQITGVDGVYMFFLNPGADPACPSVDTVYELQVIPPPGYQISSDNLPEPGILDADNCTVDAVAGITCEPSSQTTVPISGIPLYFVEFEIGIGDPGIFNNHIPLDPPDAVAPPNPATPVLPVPTLGEWARILLALMIAMLALFQHRQRFNL